MKSLGKLSLLLSGFSLIVALGARYILGGWMPILYIFLGLFLLSLIASVVLDYKSYLEVLSLKTTKDSLSLGWSLGLLLVFLVALGFLSMRFDKTFDLTEGQINSLSPQSRDILKILDEDLFIRIFYNGDKISIRARSLKDRLRDSLSLYQKESFKVKVRFIDSYVENVLAEKYLSHLPDKTQKEIFVFVEYQGKWVRVEGPFEEEAFTSAIIKVKKREKKEIYFLVGHGEKDLKDEKAEGLRIFEQYLLDSAFTLKEWSFIQDGKPPQPPALILLIGPRRPLIQEEQDWLKEYLNGGGRMLMALDPGEKHNIKEFLKEFDLDFQNNFILSQLSYFYGGKTMGIFFDTTNPITKRFQVGKDMVLFDRASVVDVTNAGMGKYKVSYLIRSHQSSFTVPELTKEVPVGDLSRQSMALEIQPEPVVKDKESHEGHLHEGEKPSKEKESDSEKQKPFRLVVFGDSDFLANKYFYQGVNRDLVLNAVVSLLDEEELISIRPKNPKKTEMTLTRNHRLGLVTFFIVLPLAFIFAASLLWFKRRQA